MTDVADRVRAVIAEQLGVEADQVIDEAALGEDLGADSLDTVELTIELEEALDVELADDEVVRLRTVGELIAYVESRVVARTAQPA